MMKAKRVLAVRARLPRNRSWNQLDLSATVSFAVMLSPSVCLLSGLSFAAGTAAKTKMRVVDAGKSYVSRTKKTLIMRSLRFVEIKIHQLLFVLGNEFKRFHDQATRLKALLML